VLYWDVRSRAPIRRLRLGLLGGAHVGGTRRMGVSLALKGGYSFTGGACRSGAGSWSGFLFR
jgi:hypothetical protein